MSEEICNKRKFYEILSKNRLLFAFAGIIVMIIGFFVPMFQNHVYYDFVPVTIHTSLWLFGLYEESIFPNGPLFVHTEWFGNVDEDKLAIASISIVSTIVLIILVLGTITVASNTLIRKRKKGIYSNRLLLYFSIGIYVALFSYMTAMTIFSLVTFSFQRFWNDYMFNTIGITFLITGAVLILMGYTLKIKKLVKILSLFIAGQLVFFGSMSILRFFNLMYSDPTQFPSYIDRVVIPAIIALSFALVIVITNIILYWKGRKKRKPLKSL